MFKKRAVKNVNRKRVEDIKDAVESEEEKTAKNRSNEENSKDKGDSHNERKREKDASDSDKDVDVVCKFLFKKRQKKQNDDKLPHPRKYDRLINAKSYEEEKNGENDEVGNEGDLMYKGEDVNSKDVGSYAVDTDIKHDHRSILERNIKICEDIRKGKLKENVYRGKDAHEKAININKDSLAKNKYTGLYGPVRSSGTNVRMTLRIDYEPCICKDYKETGYCGFGDTCIFLHDRSDYKSGWKIEQEYEQKRKREEELQKKKLEKSYKRMLKKMKEKEQKVKSGTADVTTGIKRDDNNSDVSESVSDTFSEKRDSCDSYTSDDEESLPFACLRCKKKWNLEMNPSVTECQHYFCEKCFIDMFQKSKKCVMCGLQLSGIMNSATRIIDLLNKKQARIKKEIEEED